jgi:AcrR family transcriptional regulator
MTQEAASPEPGRASARARTNRDPRAERSRTALQRALRSLLVEQPVDRVTIVALTERASVGYATFFRHYADVEELLADLSDALIGELAAILASLGSERSGLEVSQAIVRFTFERRPEMHALLLGAGEALHREIEIRAVAVGTASRPRFSEVPVDLAIGHVTRSVLTVLEWWLRDACVAPADEVAELMDRLAFVPLGTTKRYPTG